MFLIFQATTFLFVPVIIKYTGMRLLWLAMACAQVVVYLGLLLSSSLPLTITLMAIYGLVAGRCAFSYLYLVDFIPRKNLYLVSAIY